MTAEELIARYNAMTDDERSAFMERYRRALDTESVCFICDHEGTIESLRAELDRWRNGFAEAERYFDRVNEPDEAWIGANGARRESQAIGAAVYREKLRQPWTLKAGR